MGAKYARARTPCPNFSLRDEVILQKPLFGIGRGFINQMLSIFQPPKSTLMLSSLFPFIYSALGLIRSRSTLYSA
jgi:hypothetical protein